MFFRRSARHSLYVLAYQGKRRFCVGHVIKWSTYGAECILSAIGGGHAHALGAELGGDARLELRDACQIDLGSRSHLPTPAPQILVKAFAHTNKHPTARRIATDKVIDRSGHLAPPAETEEPNTEIYAVGVLKGFEKDINQLLVDVVEDFAGLLRCHEATYFPQRWYGGQRRAQRPTQDSRRPRQRMPPCCGYGGVVC